MRLVRWMTHNRTGKWFDVLDSVVTSYNATEHRSTGYAPKSVTRGRDEQMAWRQQYETQPPPPEDGPFRYQIGDTVRLSHAAKVFRRGFDYQYSLEIFRVSGRKKRAGLNIYTVEDLNASPLIGTFYRWELIPVTVDERGVFDVEEVIRSRKMKGKKHFLVRWRGYPDSMNSWISEDDFVPAEKK